MRLRWKLLLVCVVLAAAGIAACVGFAVSYAWQDAARHEGAAASQRLAAAARTLESDLDASASGNVNHLLRAFRSATANRLGYVLMMGDDYLVNNTGLALGDLTGRLSPDRDTPEISWGTFRIDGRSLLIAAWHSGRQPISLLTVRDLRALDADAAALAWRCTLFSTGILLIICLLGAHLTARTLRPLAELETAAGQIAAGDYSQRPHAGGSDEVAALSAGFCRMASAVQENMEALRTAADRQREFIGDMGHEIRTPLTAILLNAETLLRCSLPEDKRLLCTQRIASQAKWLEKLSQHLLDIVLLDAPPAPAGVCAADLAQDLRESLEGSLAASGVALEVESDGSQLWADPALLRSAAVNLINNAARASAPGTSVTVRIMQGSITVQDQGAGMPAAVLAQACEPFYTADSSRSKHCGGAGLGLTLVRRICEAYGGALRLHSTPGRGTTAEILLPESGCGGAFPPADAAAGRELQTE